MPSRIANAVSIALFAALAVCLPSIALADSGIGAEINRAASVLSPGEIAALIAVGFIPALVMIVRDRRVQTRGHRR